MKLTRYPDDLLTFLKSLRTVRFFEREPVSQEALEDIWRWHVGPAVPGIASLGLFWWCAIPER